MPVWMRGRSFVFETTLTSAPLASSSLTASRLRFPAALMSGFKPMKVSAVWISAEASSSSRMVAVSLAYVAALSGVTFRASITATFAPLSSSIRTTGADGLANARDDESRAPAPRGHVDVGAVIEQQPYLRRIGDRPHERRGAERAPGVDVGAALEQQLHGIDRAQSGRVHQWRHAVGVGLTGADAAIQRCLELRQVVGADRRIQRVWNLANAHRHGGHHQHRTR